MSDVSCEPLGGYSHVHVSNPSLYPSPDGHENAGQSLFLARQKGFSLVPRQGRAGYNIRVPIWVGHCISMGLDMVIQGHAVGHIECQGVSLVLPYSLMKVHLGEVTKCHPALSQYRSAQSAPPSHQATLAFEISLTFQLQAARNYASSLSSRTFYSFNPMILTQLNVLFPNQEPIWCSG